MKKTMQKLLSPPVHRLAAGVPESEQQSHSDNVRAYEDEPVLVVNDMQPGFAASKDALTIYAVMQQIIFAIEKNLPVILVEYDPHEMGETVPQIKQQLAGYSRLVTVVKGDDDGSAEIFEAVIDNGFWPENFIFCGVNSDACILKTVKGLIVRVPSCRITLIQDACNADNGRDCQVWHDVFPTMPNVVLRLHGQ